MRRVLWIAVVAVTLAAIVLMVLWVARALALAPPGMGNPQEITIQGDTGTATLGIGETLKIDGGNGLSTAAQPGKPNTLTPNLRGAKRASAAICLGTSDGSVTAAAEIAAATAAGVAYVLPSGCRIGLKSPGIGFSAIDLPSGTGIVCEDSTAGFFAVGQHCIGGTYTGAACTGAAECAVGGGTCGFDFGTQRFAHTTASTFTMFRNTGPGFGIGIYGCSIWTGQADAYQRCVGGSSNGNPCRQECSAGGGRDGWRCEVDGDCGGGGATCLRRSDCAAGGGACTGAPSSATSTGTAKINIFDLAETSTAVLRDLNVYDHFVGDFGVKTVAGATLQHVNIAATSNDCTSPFATPSTSVCLSTFAGYCCYGAFAFPPLTAPNTQPTTAVVDGVIVGQDSFAQNITVRGSTTALYHTTNAARFHEVVVAPRGAAGPGTYSAGIRVAGGGIGVQVFDSQVLAPKTDAVAIQMDGVGMARGNTITGLNGPSAIGIWARAAGSVVNENSITGTGGGSTGIRLGDGTTAIDSCKVQGNTVRCEPRR